jgi:GxxExxY protein
MAANSANARIAHDRIIERDLSYILNGIFFEIHNTLGRFKNEQQYCDAIEESFRKRGIRYEREKTLAASFSGERPNRNRVDFLIEGRVVIEVKAKIALERSDFEQMLRYLTTGGFRLGIIVNFGTKRLVPRRIINANT